MDVDNYKIDRKAASELLNVSLRTVDRYAKSKKLSTVVVDGRVLFNESEIKQFLGSRQVVDSVDMSTGHLSIDNMVDKVDNVDKKGQDFVHSVSTLSTSPKKREGESEVYKKLFSEMKEELHEKQERLEIANYRVGQLENQIKNSIPMLEYHRENYENKKKEETFKIEMEERKNLIEKLVSQIKYEKFSKRIFLIIILIILALQPLWLFFFNPSG